MKRHLFIVLIGLIAFAVVVSAATIPIKGYVNANIGLNVRTGPSESNTKIGALDDRTPVTIDSVSGRWYHITSPCIGYVHGDFVVVTEYGEAPDAEGTNDDFSSKSEEEVNKIGCDINKSLMHATVTKAPAQKLQ